MRNILFAGAISAATLISGTAGAQAYNPPDITPTNLTFRLGIAFPFDENTRSYAASWAGLGVDYAFPGYIIKGSETYAAADFLFRTTTGARGSIIPVTLNFRWYFNSQRNPTRDARRAYASLGLGVAFIDISSADSKLCFRGVIGTELGPNIVGEGVFVFTDRNANGFSGSTAGFYLGYRF